MSLAAHAIRNKRAREKAAAGARRDSAATTAGSSMGDLHAREVSKEPSERATVNFNEGRGEMYRVTRQVDY